MSSSAIEPLSTVSGHEHIIPLRLLATLGVGLPRTAKILDFGCGAGATVNALRALGYVNACGYDVVQGRHNSGVDQEHIKVGTVLNLRLPYDDNTFDLVISDQVFEHVQDQVRVFEELHRITAPGGYGLHLIPSRYRPLEGHILVPFGGAFQHRWLYKLWAVLGIRTRHQKDLSANEAADSNAYFAIEATRYVPTSCYRVIWTKLGFEYRFAEQEFFDGHGRSSMRRIGRLGKVAPWLYRTFRTRVVYLRKPV
ncbi:class I SAM-dependent methyltransferase [Mycolicibacterium sp. Dal123E01]|uniref:class I SAM-dependent methyltransferase n=1 Tax=Mycolicibacterium sp. Dal123E01 TaxID=3457578 RepID=UPI00403EDBEC